MSARPRMTVRMAPSRLHQVAWLAHRAGWTPAEYARVQLVSMCDAMMAKENLEPEWRRDWNDWLQLQAGKPGKAETPDQRDYDRLGERGLRPGEAAPAKKVTAETLPDLAMDLLVTGLPRAAGPEPRYERDGATIVRSFGLNGRKRRI